MIEFLITILASIFFYGLLFFLLLKFGLIILRGKEKGNQIFDELIQKTFNFNLKQKKEV